jgi:hypothetical protein
VRGGDDSAGEGGRYPRGGQTEPNIQLQNK